MKTRHLLNVTVTLLGLLFLSIPAYSQGYSFHDLLLSGQGRPIAGANAAVCQPVTVSGGVSINTADLGTATLVSTTGFVPTATLVLSGYTAGDTYLNGSYSILSVTPTTILFTIVHSTASSSTTGLAFQIGNATTSCAPLVTIYTDYTLATTKTNPTKTDGLGNYSFSVATGQYTTQLYGPGVNTTLVPFTASSGGISSFSAGNFSPLFTTTVTNPATLPALSFTASNVTAFSFYGNNTGSPAPAAITVWPGADSYIFFSVGGAIGANSNFTWVSTTGRLNVTGGAPGYCIGGCAAGDYMAEASGLNIGAMAGHDVFIGNQGNNTAYQFGGGTALPLGVVYFSGGGAPGELLLNEGGLGSGMVKGPSYSGAKFSFSGVPSCTSDIEGAQRTIIDSMTNTWGQIITGSGGDTVLGWCNGTNWTVVGK